MVGRIIQVLLTIIIFTVQLDTDGTKNEINKKISPHFDVIFKIPEFDQNSGKDEDIQIWRKQPYKFRRFYEIQNCDTVSILKFLYS